MKQSVFPETFTKLLFFRKGAVMALKAYSYNLTMSSNLAGPHGERFAENTNERNRETEIDDLGSSYV